MPEDSNQVVFEGCLSSLTAKAANAGAGASCTQQATNSGENTGLPSSAATGAIPGLSSSAPRAALQGPTTLSAGGPPRYSESASLSSTVFNGCTCEGCMGPRAILRQNLVATSALETRPVAATTMACSSMLLMGRRTATCSLSPPRRMHERQRCFAAADVTSSVSATFIVPLQPAHFV
eukprot:566809-Pleurochrysis_carterae.AAC.2